METQTTEGSMGRAESGQVVAGGQWASKLHRLNSGMYHIVDKDRQEVPFKLNSAQGRLYEAMWPRTLIPKARQEGVTTFCELFSLDTCLFVPNTTAVVIAHTQDDAKVIFETKVLFPYRHLPDQWKLLNPLTGESKTRLEFSNGSSMTVDVSAVSRTVSLLHVSEFGRICARRPAVAEEIVAGSLEAVPKNGVVWFESTCKGRSGHFWKFCEEARKRQESGAGLQPMEFDLHFIPWWMCREYRVFPGAAHVKRELADYFALIESKIGQKLDAEQRAWYATKVGGLGPLMKQEYPSTYEEAWEVALEGSFWQKEVAVARAEGRITRVAYVPGIPVDTWWDLGIGLSGYMAIWFTQTIGCEVHVIDFYESYGVGFPHYANILKARGYFYGEHNAPHDIAAKELGTGVTRWESAAKLGITFRTIPRIEHKADAVEAGRNFLQFCWFDEGQCDKGLEHLEEYSREWDDANGCWRSTPKHDIHSNGADAFQTLACGHGPLGNSIGRKKSVGAGGGVSIRGCGR